MKFSRIARGRGAILAIVSASLLAGCATSFEAATPENAVKQRAQARWDVLLKYDFDAAYKFTAPSFRAVTQVKSYANRFGSAANWSAAKVSNANCEAERCTVSVEVTAVPLSQITAGAPVTVNLEEVWIREANEWWLYVRR